MLRIYIGRSSSCLAKKEVYYELKKLRRFALTAVSILVINSLTIPVFAADIDEPEGTAIPEDFDCVDDNNYVEITDDSVSALSFNDSYEESIGMTDEEVLELFNDYLSSLPETYSETPPSSAEHLNDFVEYAVEEGIIEDTPVQRTAITKAVVRAQFKEEHRGAPL